MLRTGMARLRGRRASILAACAIACVVNWGGEAFAQTSTPDYAHMLQMLQQQEQRLNDQQHQLQEQQQQLVDQRALIERQLRQMNSGDVADADLADMTGEGLPSMAYQPLDSDQPLTLHRAPVSTFGQSTSGSAPAPAPVQMAQAVVPAVPDRPVGEAPPQQQTTTVEALPEGQTALSGRGKLTIEPSFEYSRSSSNRLVFRGVEIVTGIQIGLIEASDTARDTISSSVAARYALSDRLEIEGRVPYIYRNDRVTTLAQNNNTVTQTFELNGGDIGDIEASLRYQLNNPRHGGPIYVAGARIKSTTGKGPFDVARDNNGVASELATGSGFWGVQGSFSVLYPSDPVVLFANASYLYNITGDVNRTVGTVHIGDVDPGDSIGLGFGMGFALNPRFSYSLGYSHNYIMPTESELNGTHQRSTSLQVGALQFGMSFRATERLTIATSVEAGLTEDAPDVRIGIRTPYRF